MAGLASLPVSVGIVLSAGISPKLVERLPPRAVAVPGLLVAAVGLYWLSTLTVGSSYAWHVLPALFVTYFGLGMGFMPMTLTAVCGVAEEQAGVAAALLNPAQQIGAALGLSVPPVTTGIGRCVHSNTMVPRSPGNCAASITRDRLSALRVTVALVVGCSW